MKRAAAISNSTTEEFQKAAFAAGSVGIEMEKLGDIYKDVNDKVGEFLQTGGGEMKDFFDTIAPKVGVTAEQFRNLSGPQALQLYVSSLEKAGLNQQEMTFYMEALADEASALTPILRNNGEGMRKLSEDAMRMGIVLDENLIQNAGNAASTMNTLNTVLSMQITAAVAANASEIADFTSTITNFTIETVKAINAWNRFNGEMDKRSSAKAIFRRKVDTRAAEQGWSTDHKRKVLEIGNKELDRLYGVAPQQEGWSWSNNPLWSVRTVSPKSGQTRAGNVPSAAVPDVVRTGFVPGKSTGASGGRGRQAGSGKAATSELDEFTKKLAALHDRLYPEIEALREYREELDLIAEAFARGKFTAEQAADARRRRALEGRGEDKAFTEMMADGRPTQDMEAINEGLTILQERMTGLRTSSGQMRVEVAKSFKDMADETIDALNTMTSAIQGGGILNILSAVLKMGLQLGSIGAFGGKVQANINAYQKRAWGGPVNAGQMYMVGERGPEMFVSGSNGTIVPNHRLGFGSVRGGGNTYYLSGNLMTPEFWGRIQAGDVAAAQVGAQTGVNRIQKAGARSLGR